MRRTLLTLLLCLNASAHAEAPKAVIHGPTSVAPGSMIVLDARESVSDKPLRWRMDAPKGAFLLPLDWEDRKGVIAVVPAAPAGTYRFTLVAKGTPKGAPETELDADAEVWTVSVSTPAPPPSPPPTPAPLNPLSPVAGTLHVSLVADLDDSVQERATAELRAGLRARPAIQALNAIYRVYPATSPELDRVNLRATTTRVGTPCLIVQDSGGRVVAAEKAPATEDGIIARVKAIRGQ